MTNNEKNTNNAKTAPDLTQCCIDPFLIGIEFFCGACCAKVTNGKFIFTIPGFICLLPPVGEFLLLEKFSDDECISVQYLASICIAIDKICAIEGCPITVFSACQKHYDHCGGK